MTDDLKKAKEILQNGTDTCVLCKADRVYRCTETGIRPMMRLLSDKVEMEGFSVADKIVGKAAALLFVLAGIKEVYAPVMSEAAARTLSEHGIAWYCDTQAERIINRQGTDICPMEKTVQDISDPEQAYAALQRTLQALSQRKESGK